MHVCNFRQVVMPRDNFTISSNERELICSAVTSDLRLDGRGPFDFRKYDFRFLGYITFLEHSAFPFAFRILRVAL